MPTNKLENGQSKKSVKLIIGIVLAIVLLGGGGYLVYKFWPKKSSEQTQQEQEKKAKLQRQIKLIKEKIVKEKTVWEKNKAGQDLKFDPFDELPEEIVFSNPDKEIQELQKEKKEVLEEYKKLQKEIREDLALHPDQANEQVIEDESLAKALADWNRQKNNQWMVITEELDKDPAVKAKFDQIITTFYHRYKDSKKNSIPTHPGVDFRGFRNFYIDRKGGSITEMGNTGPPEGDGGEIIKTTESTGKISTTIKSFPLEIKLNQLYLLNNGRNPGGAMNKFYYEKPTEKIIKHLDINFNKLRKTIAHEIAHAFQNAKNISEDKAVDTEKGVSFGTISDCMESGEGERDEDHNLIKPVNPELVYEHKRFEIEIEAMLEKSTEFKEFERWWKATS